MIYKEFYLEDVCPRLPDVGTKTKATLYVPALSPEIDMNRRFPCVVIYPGGGYGMTSDREAEPLALRFLGQGIAAFIIRYAVSPVRFPTQLLETSAAVAWIREHAEEYHINPKNITVMGFSAGGHAAASTGILWKEDCIKDILGYENGENRPDGMILCYPVITSGEKAYRGSFVNLLGEFTCPELLEKVSLEKQVDDTTPPAFLWHTYDDGAVPVENSLYLACALREHNVPCELHIYPHGVHGLSLGDLTSANPDATNLINPDVTGWIDLCIRWVKNLA